MLNNVAPRKVFYFLMALFIVAIIIHIVTNKDQFLFAVLLMVGLVGLTRPRIILDFIQDENRKGKMILDPLFPEKVYKAIGFLGGLSLVIISVGYLFFNLKF
jgi:hypothetical protein